MMLLFQPSDSDFLSKVHILLVLFFLKANKTLCKLLCHFVDPQVIGKHVQVHYCPGFS